MTNEKEENFQPIRIARNIIYLTVFLLPLFFLPFTVNALDFNKQALLAVAGFTVFFLWLLYVLREERLDFNIKNNYMFLLAALGLSILVSTFLSVSPYNSFWGFPLPAAQSSLTLVSLILLAISLPHIFKEKQEVFGLVFVSAVSTFLVAIYGIFQLFGKFVLPFDFSKTIAFNTIGSVNSLAVFVAVAMPLIVGLIFASRRTVGLVLTIFILTGLALLLMVNFWVAWLCLLVSSSVFLFLNTSRKEVFDRSWSFLPMTLMAVAVFMLFVKMPLFSFANLPVEVSPSLSSSMKISTQTLKQGLPLSLLFGSGPATFVFDYSRYKPVEINQTVFWSTRFNVGSSELIDKLATSGVFGIALFLLLAAAVTVRALKWFLNREEKDNYSKALIAGAYASFLGAIVSMIFYSVNLSLTFLFWFLTALILTLIGRGNKQTVAKADEAVKDSGKQPDDAAKKGSGNLAPVMLSFVFTIVLVLGLGILFMGIQRYVAEVNYFKALVAVQSGNNEVGISRLATALRLTGGKQDSYWRDLSQVYLYRINEVVNNQSISQEERSRQLNDLISQMIESSRMATAEGPKNVANWTIRGFVYSNIASLFGGADDWAIQCFEEANRLEPTNPAILNEIGNVYLAKYDRLTEEKKTDEANANLDKAREYFERALALKQDYATSRYQLAMIDIRLGDAKKAIDKLEIAKSFSPDDTGLAFQLGLIYRADNQLSKAQQEFERAVYLDPNYSNARYFLGLVYDTKGDKSRAIEQFVQIEKLNPDNQEIKEILANLKAGRGALSGVVSGQPPIQEESEEKLEQ